MDGVVYELVAEANKLPPVMASYQSIVPVEAVAAKLAVPVPQMDAGVVVMILGMVLIVAVTAVLEGEKQVPLSAST